jgi:hypothetical protein
MADFRPGRMPGRRLYEPADLNFVPTAGMTTLARPGPHLRIWYVPGAVNERAPFIGDPPAPLRRPLSARDGRAP